MMIILSHCSPDTCEKDEKRPFINSCKKVTPDNIIRVLYYRSRVLKRGGRNLEILSEKAVWLPKIDKPKEILYCVNRNNRGWRK